MSRLVLSEYHVCPCDQAFRLFYQMDASSQGHDEMQCRPNVRLTAQKESDITCITPFCWLQLSGIYVAITIKLLKMSELHFQRAGAGQNTCLLWTVFILFRKVLSRLIVIKLGFRLYVPRPYSARCFINSWLLGRSVPFPLKKQIQFQKFHASKSCSHKLHPRLISTWMWTEDAFAASFEFIIQAGSSDQNLIRTPNFSSIKIRAHTIEAKGYM